MMLSPKSSVFHFSWYLEMVDDDWSALVGEGYAWVVPFFSEKKQIIWPQTIPYLGLISRERLSEDNFQDILDFWNQHYTQVNYFFSKYHFLYQQENIFGTRYFFQKDLINKYEEVSKSFLPRVHENLKIAEQQKLSSFSLRSLFQFMEFLKIHTDWPEQEILVIRKIISRATQLRAGKMYGIYNSSNELVGVLFILFIKSKAYIMFSAFNEQSQEPIAAYKAVNTLIEDLSIYNITVENHCTRLDADLLKDFAFKPHYSYKYQHNAKQNLLSLLLRFLRKD